MEPGRPAQRLTIYFGESDRWQGRPLHTALLDALRAAGIAGATVTRGVAGFGAHGRIHRATLAELSADLPMIIEVVDTPERIAATLATVSPMVMEGLITLEEVQVVMYAHRYQPRLPAQLAVQDVMSRNVASVEPGTPLADVVQLLVERDVKAVPVVDDQHQVVGIVTGGDLLAGGAIPVRLSLQKDFPNDLAAHHLEQLEASDKTAQDIMTAPALTIQAAAHLTQAARLMADRHIKRLPVVDDQNQLVGIVSRLDVLRAASQAASEGPPLPPPPAGVGLQVRDIMVSDVPTARPDTPISNLLPALINSPMRRAVVVDNGGRVVGLIADAMLMDQALPEEKPGLWASVRHALGLGGGPAVPRPALRAEDVMTRDVFTIPANAPILDAIQQMVERRVKRLVVVDEVGRLLGMVDRQRALQSLAAE